MTLTETTTQAALETNEDLRIQELFAASQKLLNQSQPSNPNNNNNGASNNNNNPISTNLTTTDTPTTSAFSMHPEIISQDRNQPKPRKNSKKKNVDNYNFGDASDYSLPVSNNGSTPSLISMTGIPPSPPTMNPINLNNNGNNISSSSNIPHSNNNKSDRGKSSSSHRERADINKDIPTGPPELIRDPTTETFSSHAYGWPILFAVIPPMGALIFGKSDIWSDFLLLLLIAFYLYNIIKVPWELYYAARSRRVINENTTQDQTLDPTQEAIKNQAIKELQRQELYALTLVVASPIIGGYTLHGAKMYMTDYDKYISHFNIVLFVFAAGIRPLMHIANLAKNRTLHLQEQVHYPSTEVELLKRRVQHLEYEFSQLRKGLATKRDILNVKDGFEPSISQLNKAVRRYEKKEQYLRNYSEERFSYLESKLLEYDNFIAYKLQEEQAMILPRSMKQVVTLPVNVTLTAFSYAKYFLPRSLRGGRQKPMLQPATSSDNDADGYNNNIISSNKLTGENIQQNDLTSGILQKY